MSPARSLRHYARATQRQEAPRREPHGATVTFFAAVAVRLAIGIVLDALAFTIWNVGTRPPLQLLRDVRRAGTRPRVLAWGMIRFLTGFALLVLAALVIAPAMPSSVVFRLVETGMLLVALLVEALVGPDLRRLPRA